jgi:hypothetical protein
MVRSETTFFRNEIAEIEEISSSTEDYVDSRARDLLAAPFKERNIAPGVFPAHQRSHLPFGEEGLPRRLEQEVVCAI